MTQLSPVISVLLFIIFSITIILLNRLSASLINQTKFKKLQ